MSSPKNDKEEPSSSNDVAGAGGDNGDGVSSTAAEPRPPAKRRLSSTVIEISDTESDDSDVCAVTSYQASADEVKRIRGDYDSSSCSSSSSSDSYSSESECEDDSVVVPDARPVLKPPRASLNPRAHRTEDPKLNSKFKSLEITEKLKSHWTERKNLNIDEVTLTCEPFRLCLLHDLLENSDIINNIIDDMNTLDWERKKMDLYEFHQTVDLSNLTWQRSIKGIYELLKTEIMSWVSSVTGLELTSVSASCSLYAAGDHLLAHDDLLGSRRVAFILYLAPWTPAHMRTRSRPLHNGKDNGTEETVDVDAAGWTESMGGALELYSRDDDGRPTHVTHHVLPRNNMMAFFQVGTDSFHRVAEVVSLELPRLSINGWFHGAEAEPIPEPPHPPPPEIHTPHNNVVLLSQWMSQSYMSPSNRCRVQHQMERDSEVELRDFLDTTILHELLEALDSPDVEWESAGPANQRQYSRVSPGWAETQSREHPIKSILSIYSSSHFAKFLKDCTDLTIVGYSSLELQRWKPGDFTLLPARSWYESPRLQCLLFFGVCAGLRGAAVTFVAPEDGPGAPPPTSSTVSSASAPSYPQAPHDAALVTVYPNENAMSLVYCDAGAACFTKYVSKLSLASTRAFYLLTATYHE